jgi:GTPase SAR1 family protein
MYSWDNAQVVLVGNKCDLEQDRAVTQERGKRLADQLGNFFKYCILNVRFKYNCSFVFSGRFSCFIYMLCCMCCLLKGSTDKDTFMGKNPGCIGW